MNTLRWLGLALISIHVAWAADNHNLFRYDESQPFNLEEKSVETNGSIVVHDVRVNDVAGQSVAGYLVVPQGKGPFAAVLYVHWLGDPATSNRTQFLKEAEQVSQQGAVTLLIDMPWSVPGWFQNRKTDEDYASTIRQVQNLRRFLDFLLQRPEVDRKRVAYVGHDFGATFGAILVGVDPRIKYAVFMAGTPILSDWFLLGSKIQGDAREAYIKKMAPLDPINFIGKAKSVPMLLQFASHDQFIPKEKAEQFANSAHDPKDFRWYDIGHEMNAQAASDRVTWLETQLNISPKPSGQLSDQK
jgi:dienelactone hydrolase